MRAALKIKTSFIFLAWLTIFAHSIIPHNHADEICYRCNGLIHNCSSVSNDNSKSSKLETQDADLKICHLANFIFHNFNPEDFFPYFSRDINFVPSGFFGKIFYNTDHSLISLHPFSTVSFRAPPLA